MSKPRILFFDIETAAKKIYAWGDYDVNAIATYQHWHMISFAWKWSGDKETHVKALPDYRMYKKDKTNDKCLIQDLWKLFDEADIIISHNGIKFDLRKSNARFIFHGMKPPSPYQVVDTRDVARKHFRFDSNKLDNLGDYLGIGRKINTGGFDLWLGCERGDKKSWGLMKKYNKMDVILLEKVYLKLRPYMNLHPNLGLLQGNKKACPQCGSLRVHANGTRATRTTLMQRYCCADCGAWSSSPIPKLNSKTTPQVR